MVALSACASSAPSPAAPSPIPVESAWYPGLLLAGHAGQGLGPDASTSGSPTSSTPSPASSSSSASGASPAPSDSTLDDAVQQRLDEVSIQKTDVTGLTVSLGTNGTTLAQPSLAYCEKTFASERSREARRHVDVLNASGKRAGISSEAVLYLTPSDATQALAELRSGAAACAATRTVTTGGHTLTVVQRSSADVPVVGLVAEKQRLLLAAIVTDATDPKAVITYRIQHVWQQRGRLLVGVFVESAGSDLTRDELAAIGQLTATVATRLARLDSALTGAS